SRPMAMSIWACSAEKPRNSSASRQRSNWHFSLAEFATHQGGLLRADQQHGAVPDLVEHIVESAGQIGGQIQVADAVLLAEPQYHVVDRHHPGELGFVEAAAIQLQSIEAAEPVIVVGRTPF